MDKSERQLQGEQHLDEQLETYFASERAASSNTSHRRDEGELQDEKYQGDKMAAVMSKAMPRNRKK